jgi:hypothetical protein
MRRPPELFPLILGPPKAGADPFLNHRALTFGEHAKHLEHRLAAGRGRVEPLLMQEEVDPERVQLGKKADQVLQATAKPVHRPRHHEVEFALRRVSAKPVERGA